MSKNICVWKNPMVTDIGRQLECKLLIENNIMYMSDFIVYIEEGNGSPIF